MSLTRPKEVSLSAAGTSSSSGKTKRRADGTPKPPQSRHADISDDDDASLAPSDVSSENSSDDDDDDEGTLSDVEVDFDFFDLVSTDFHALNTLLKQLFGSDGAEFEFGGLSDLLIDECIGTTVKVLDDDDEDQKQRGADPYAFLAAVDLVESVDKDETLQEVWKYLLAKSKSDAGTYAAMSSINNAVRTTTDSSGSSGGKVGLVLGERLINMPIEIAPALYTYLRSDLAAKGVEFERLVLVSRCYTEVASTLSESDDASSPSDDDEDDRAKRRVVSKKTAKRLARDKKRTSKKASAAGKKNVDKEIMYFHPEDAILRKHADQSCVFEYTRSAGGNGSGGRESDTRRAFTDFGIRESGLVMVFGKKNWLKAIDEVVAAFGQA